MITSAVGSAQPRLQLDTVQRPVPGALGVVEPDMLSLVGGGDAERVVGRFAFVDPEHDGLFGAVPEPLRTVLADAVSGRTRGG